VLEVPEDYKPNFLADYDIALRDIAGISVVGAMGFITQEMITPNVTSDRANPFYQDYYEIGVHDSKTIEDQFHLGNVPTAYKALPMYIHVDFAETSDHIGICGLIQDGTKNVYDIETERKVMMPFYRQVFQVAIGAPRGDRMSFQKVINFIVWLRKNSYYIRMVTTDQYQSSYVLENLSQQGFETNKISVDRTEDPYITLRSLLTDQRIELIKHDLQEVELINLQRVNNTIDHKPQHSSKSEVPSLANGYNSKGIGKDSSDALCGACYAAVKYGDQVRPPSQNIIGAISSVNGGRGYARRPDGRPQYIPGFGQFGSQYRRW
jgi:hypothetical protein